MKHLSLRHGGEAARKGLQEERLTEAPPPAEMPQRYSVREGETGRTLTCIEAPTVQVRIERGMTVTRSAARGSAAGSIFLDGAAEGEPFLDVKKRVYNLDHHDGVVRSFTLSTCEQAIVLIRRGLDLQAREWTLLANEPDLDAVLAIWVLLNHMRLRGEDSEQRAKVMPLLRLEGCIDVHGLALQDLCGFPEELRERTFQQLEALKEEETELKRSGEWSSVDALEYTRDLLGRIDRLVYSPFDFEEVIQVEELARAELPKNSFVVACRAEAEIYEVEANLQRLYGDRLGVIILERAEGLYTIRQVDPFLPAGLDDLYRWLNLIDPAAGNRSSGNRWGGSPEIGGSPRRSGSRLSPQELTRACRRVYTPNGAAERLRCAAQSVLGVLLGVGGSWLGAAWSGWGGGRVESLVPLGVDRTAFPFAWLLLAVAVVLVAWKAPRGRGLLGLHLPGGPRSSWWLAPVGLGAGLMGGCWALAGPTTRTLGWWAGALALALGVELLFRGLSQGLAVRAMGTVSPGSLWRPSPATWVSATLYALVTAAPLVAKAPALAGFGGPWSVLQAGVAALLFGVAAGSMRERTESLLPGILVHWLVLVVLTFLPR